MGIAADAEGDGLDKAGLTADDIGKSCPVAAIGEEAQEFAIRYHGR